MTYIVYLVLLMSIDPSPTYMILDDFDTMKQCQTRLVEFAKQQKLNINQTATLRCQAVITSPLTEPL